MVKKISLLFWLSLIILALAACSIAVTPVSVTSMPSAIPPKPTAPPPATPIPPTETPTALPPTSTATTLPGNAIQHFPTGQEFTVTSIHMVDANTGWAIGGLTNLGDHVLYTTDGGSTWKDITPPESVAVSGEQKTATGFFQNAQTAWVIYAPYGYIRPSHPVVWRTHDGGTTWQASQPLDLSGLPETFVPSDIQFVGQAGWMLVHVGVGMNHDYVALYHSTDSGLTWTRTLDPNHDGGIQPCSKTGMLFTDATHGWLTGDCEGVAMGVLLFKSNDAGATWQEVSLPEPPGTQGLYTDMYVACGSYDLFFFSNDLGHLSVRCFNFKGTPITNNYYVYTTRDGGATWTVSTYPGIGLYFFSADTGWAISQKIQLTTDGGLTWKPIADVSWNPQFDFISEQIGWGVAWSKGQVALVKTDNGGAHWTMLVPTVGK